MYVCMYVCIYIYICIDVIGYVLLSLQLLLSGGSVQGEETPKPYRL